MNDFYIQYKKFKAIIFFSFLNLKQGLRKILNRDIYHVIGDSHSLNFIHDAFIIHHVGPATAYKLNFEKSTTNSRKKVINILNKIYKNKPISVIFVFGELDARIHIYKIYKEKNININILIKKTIESYMDFLNLIKKRFPLINIYIFNVLPQGEEENVYKFSYYASMDKRRDIAENMNRLLVEHTRLNNIKFIDIYSKLIDRNGKRKKEYIFDDVHFNRKIIPYVLNSINTLNKN